MRHVRRLLELGFLPITVDYRLCPETTLLEGPVSDCCDAIRFIREDLQNVRLLGPRVFPDASKVLAAGCSSGGLLVLNLDSESRLRGIKGPDVILAFYAPSDLQSDRESLVISKMGILFQGSQIC